MLVVALLACHHPADTSPGESAETDGAPYDDDLGVTCTTPSEALPDPPTPVASFPFLPTANGWVSATYALQQHAIMTFTDHLPRNPTPTTATRDLAWDAYFGVRVDGAGHWLNDVPETSAAYAPGTGIVTVAQRHGDLQIETAIFAPFQAGATRDLVVIATVTNRGSVPHAVALYSLQNLHAGGEGSADGESVAASGDAVIETRGADRLTHLPLGTPTARAAAPSGDDRNPWVRLNGGADLGGDLVSGDDVAVGFEWDLGTLAPNQSATRGFVIDWNGDTTWARGRSADDVADAERAEWDAWHAGETVPTGLSADEAAVLARSTAVLRMAQVREDGPGKGQILASLPPGSWNIAWPRDAAYATVGLVHTGHQDEARAALQFVLDGDAGTYADRLGLDDYLVSVARYFGDGTEESDGATCPDGSDAGPNVELDDFGLYLWAYGEYANRWPDDGWIAETRPAVLAGVADPLVALIDPNRDLLVPDSSIWERHWESCFPNGRKRFTYSNVQAIAGLRAAAAVSGDARYEEAADRLRRGLLGPSADGGPAIVDGECPFLASAPEEVCTGCGPLDAATIEVVDQGVIRPESSLARGELVRLQEGLGIGGGSPGFKRNDDGTGSTNPYPWYDDQEWVVIDLRMAVAYAMVGRATDDPTLEANGRTLVDWVTAQARANFDLLPELLSDGRYTPEDDADQVRPGTDLGAEFQGAVPMCGFGPGAYILALEAVHAP